MIISLKEEVKNLVAALDEAYDTHFKVVESRVRQKKEEKRTPQAEHEHVCAELKN